MFRRLTILALLALTLVPAACRDADRGLETRTFRIRSLEESEARDLVSPYVFAEREGAPGALSVTRSAVTVRELPENLDRIEDVLREFDRSRAPLTFHFLLIEADGFEGTDPEIAELEGTLRQVFRFEGYRLIGSSMIQGPAAGYAQQLIRGGDRSYDLAFAVRDSWGSADSLMVHLDLQLHDASGEAVFRTQLTAQAGKTVIAGTSVPRHGGETEALILAVTPLLAER